MRSTTIVAGALLLLLVASCGLDDDGPPEDTGIVQGTVTGAISRAPLAQIGVILIDPGTIGAASPMVRTNILGRYRIEEVPPGRYAVFFFPDSSWDLPVFAFDRDAPTVSVGAGTSTVHNAVLMDRAPEGVAPSPYWIAGHVIDAESHAPLAGAYVAEVFDGSSDLTGLFAGSGSPTATMTGPDGSFRVRSEIILDGHLEPAGLMPISVSRSGYEPATLVGEGLEQFPGVPALPLPAGGDSILTVIVRLHPAGGSPVAPGGISGDLRFLGAPVAGARVAVSLLAVSDPDTLRIPTLREAAPIPDRVAVSDAAGHFLIEGLLPGFYVIHPAYLDGDGFLTDSPVPSLVEAGLTASAGDVRVARAIRPVYPAEGSEIEDATPELRWEAQRDTLGIPFGEYVLNLTVGTTPMEERLTEPRWQVPDSSPLPRGAYVRWSVRAFSEKDSASALTRRMAAFEHTASFQIAR